MDAKTSQMLNELNKRFYEENAESFSRTRENPWKGWDRLVPAIRAAEAVLDVACGNLRFERYVESLGLEALPDFHCVDTCPALVNESPQVSFQRLDIVGLIIDGVDIAECLEAPSCDLVVSFGFFHHVPGAMTRETLLGALIEKTNPGGVIALSFWQFMKDQRLAAKARAYTETFQERYGVSLEEGDYLLGWQDSDDACRYCHSFEDSEIDELIKPYSNSAKTILRYSDDGKSVPLNAYVVLQKH